MRSQAVPRGCLPAAQLSACSNSCKVSVERRYGAEAGRTMTGKAEAAGRTARTVRLRPQAAARVAAPQRRRRHHAQAHRQRYGRHHARRERVRARRHVRAHPAPAGGGRAVRGHVGPALRYAVRAVRAHRGLHGLRGVERRAGHRGGRAGRPGGVLARRRETAGARGGPLRHHAPGAVRRDAQLPLG